ncbi:MAG: hypothetical protein GQ477_03825 [Nanohaloarchaea archaeon]|nr:hypothetical protein [Candidatus Nanohaloarchaea archaeon]
MAFSKIRKKGELTIETVIIIVLFLAVLAIVILVVSSLMGKGTDQMGTSIESSGGGALCEIECMKCCSSSQENCGISFNDVDISSCCDDKDPNEPGCSTPP